MNPLGRPTSKPKIERISDLERRYVAEVLESGFHTSAGGSMTAVLEARFAERYGVGYAVAFVNGTATMHAALVAAGVGRVDPTARIGLASSGQLHRPLEYPANVKLFGEVSLHPMRLGKEEHGKTMTIHGTHLLLRARDQPVRPGARQDVFDGPLNV